MTRKEQAGRAEWGAVMAAAGPHAVRRQYPPMVARRVDTWLPELDVARLDAELVRLSSASHRGGRLTRSELVRLAVRSWLDALGAVDDADLRRIWARVVLRGCRHSVPGRRPGSSRSARRLRARSRSRR